MARPRTIDADVIATFHCTYLLKAAISRSSRTVSDNNTSTYIRLSLEASCRHTLGESVWMQLQQASSITVRRQLLDAFLNLSEVNRLRRGIDSPAAKATDERLTAMLLRAIDDYLREFEAAYDLPQTDIALCVALEEAIDTIRKIKSVFIRDQLDPKDIRLLQRLAARFPDRLRADFDAATLSRIVSEKRPKHK